MRTLLFFGSALLALSITAMENATPPTEAKASELIVLKNLVAHELTYNIRYKKDHTTKMIGGRLNPNDETIADPKPEDLKTPIEHKRWHFPATLAISSTQTKPAVNHRYIIERAGHYSIQSDPTHHFIILETQK